MNCKREKTLIKLIRKNFGQEFIDELNKIPNKNTSRNISRKCKSK
jgi:hypothetical protein